MEQEIKLMNLVKELLKRDVIVHGCELKGDSISYLIDGFAKSGRGELYLDENGSIKLETRYSQVDSIETLEDIVKVAYGWDSSYCRKDDFWCVVPCWKALYDEFGLDTKDLNVF